ncbi:helix-turn-helix domain-containing protein [Brevundimonas sp.]|uniref:helix-turn-helix domain-containing protein n=2 Tax=Brevundimonas sp. TaxID=1871086 RepID=UPI0040338F3E
MLYPRMIAWDVSTATLPDALERYMIGMADIYEVSGISDEDQANFFNHTRSILSAVGGVGTGRSVRQTLSRGSALLKKSQIDGLNLVINRAATVGEYDGREARAEPGALQFRDFGRLSSTRLEAVDLMSIMVPRNLAPPPLLGPDMHGRILSPDLPGVRLVKGLMQVLIEEADQLTEAALDSAIQSLLLVVGRVAGIETPIGAPEISTVYGSVRRLAVDFIEARVRAKEVTFGAAETAVAAGVSRATLYRSFEGIGGVNRYIQDRRLHHARDGLRRRRDMQLSIAEVAWSYGFTSMGHFNRLFRERYGYPPSDVPPADIEPEIALSEGPIRHDLLSDWLAEIGTQKA